MCLVGGCRLRVLVVLVVVVVPFLCGCDLVCECALVVVMKFDGRMNG